MTEEQLKRNIKTYKELKKAEKLLEKRLFTLNKGIKKDLIERGVTPEFSIEEYGVHLKLKKKKPEVDELEMERILEEKGLLELCIKEVIDHDLVEAMYLDGKLTDQDLRRCKKPGEYILALEVAKDV